MLNVVDEQTTETDEVEFSVSKGEAAGNSTGNFAESTKKRRFHLAESSSA